LKKRTKKLLLFAALRPGRTALLRYGRHSQTRIEDVQDNPHALIRGDSKPPYSHGKSAAGTSSMM
jgi:hypothetical protein